MGARAADRAGMTQMALFTIGRVTPAKLAHGTSGRRGVRIGAHGDITIYMRSRWERNVARWLTYTARHWKYEPTTFWFAGIKRGTMCYTPDFYLGDEDRYIEVKGYNDQKSRTRAKRMAKYYPHVAIEVIDAAKYRDIERNFAHLIPTWEADARTPNRNEDRPGQHSRRVRVRTRCRQSSRRTTPT